jgi:NAD(P)H dehydrogenase (quinone)
MKHLVIYCHPYTKSFNHAIKEAYIDTLRAHNHEVRVRDLYEMSFDPVLKASDLEMLLSGRVPEDIKLEQDHVSWADIITVIHPTWWHLFPAELKGYFERVFSHGFAYDVNEDETAAIGLLAGKKIIIITTTGAPQEYYEKTGLFKSMDHLINDYFILCGIEVIMHKYFFGVPYITHEQRTAMLEEVKEIVGSVDEG